MNQLSIINKYVCYFDKHDNLINWKYCKSIEKPYWTAVFKNLNFPLEIIVTENTKYLPKYGKNIVVILKSDEFASDIQYSDRVRAVFRNYFDTKYRNKHNIFFLPLPYLGKLNGSSMKPILKRKTDVFFAGQVTCEGRKELLQIILNLEKKYKNLKFVFKRNDKFFSGWDKSRYLNKLGNSKISLCPQGASTETYRHFESLHQGCLVISKSLPDVWYFKDAPIQIVRRWQDLFKLLIGLTNNSDLLKTISIKSVQHWNKKLSPLAVANFINDCMAQI